MNNTYRDIAGSLGWPDAYTPFVRCVPVDTPNQHKLKPLGFVTLAELDEMSMKPNKTPQ